MSKRRHLTILRCDGFLVAVADRHARLQYREVGASICRAGRGRERHPPRRPWPRGQPGLCLPPAPAISYRGRLYLYNRGDTISLVTICRRDTDDERVVEI